MITRRILLTLTILAAAGSLVSSAREVPTKPPSPLTITRPKLVSEDGSENVTLVCQLSADLEMQGDTCTFTHVTRNTKYEVNISTGDVTDENGDVLEDPVGIPDDQKRVCGIKFYEFDPDLHLGEWSCRLPTAGAAAAFHEGDFHVLSAADDHVHDIRLPTHIVPQLYTVHLIPFLDEDKGFPIDGKMSLDFHLDHADEEDLDTKIVLHAKDMVIDEDSVVLTDELGEQFSPIGHGYDLDREQYIIHFEKPMAAVLKYTISMGFMGSLNDDLVGFYRSSYKDEEGNQKFLATTQFETTDARRAFPCMDEPAMKSKFKIFLGRANDTNTMSNMPQVDDGLESDYEGYTYDEYDISEVMSTYLLAFVVSDFIDTPSESDAKNRFSVHHMAGKQAQTVKANEFGPKVLDYYEEYFGIDYPLPKLDMGAIPDFDAGAMENWGFVLYREQMLLFQDGVSSKADEDLILEVVAHELAHMWFGNLVTMEWWTDLWLNEGKYIQRCPMLWVPVYMKPLDLLFLTASSSKKNLTLNKVSIVIIPVFALRCQHLNYFQDLPPTSQALAQILLSQRTSKETECFWMTCMMFLALMPLNHPRQSPSK